MPRMSDEERHHYREGELGPGVSERRVSSLPKIEGPQVWELSAHPHEAERAGKHIDLRLGNPATGIAHSFVLPKRTALPKPGEMALAVPTYDHTLGYMDYAGPITTDYGRGVVQKGRRAKTEVYHAEPNDPKKTLVRFNLYDGPQPEEFAIVRTKKGALLINKTQTREKRPDIPAEKPTYGEVPIDNVDPTNDRQVMMPKLDGAHGVIDLRAGRSPRVFSYRVAKKAETGLIEHTHKMPELLKDKVPKELDGTILRGEILAVGKGGVLPAEQIGGMLNSKVWESRAKQQEVGARLQAFPFDVVKYKGREMSGAPFSEKLKVLKEVEEKIADLWIPEIAVTPVEKIDLLNKVKSKQHPLTEEGVVLVEPGRAARPIKAKIAPDFDVYVRKVHPAKSGKTGELHDRAGSISYSWTPDGPIVGQVGGFKHDEGRDMLRDPDEYVGRVAKVRATKMFKGKNGEMGALFQPRFHGWHLDKGAVEKTAKFSWGPLTGGLAGAGIGGGLGGLAGYYRPTDRSGQLISDATGAQRRKAALRGATGGALAGGILGAHAGDIAKIVRQSRGARQAQGDYYRAHEEARRKAWEEQGRRRSRAWAGGATGGGTSYARPSWLKDAKTKAEAKSMFREQAKRTHPDRGGSDEAMKKLNDEWEKFQDSADFFKMSSAFLDELTKIAGLEGRVLSQVFRHHVQPPVSDAIRDLEDRARARWMEFNS